MFQAFLLARWIDNQLTFPATNHIQFAQDFGLFSQDFGLFSQDFGLFNSEGTKQAVPIRTTRAFI